MKINKKDFRIINLRNWREKQNANSGREKGRGNSVGNKWGNMDSVNMEE